MDYFTILDDIARKYFSLNNDDPCLCGSGKLFKDCHKLSDLQIPVNLDKVSKSALKVFTKKTCYFQDEYCSNIKTASHTIPKSSLRTIATDNHVLCFICPNAPELSKLARFDQILPSEIGINDAGVFNGFCSHHDNVVFSPIEQNHFECTEQQHCLLLFRALCKELYTSSESAKMIPVYRQLIESKGNPDYRNFLNIMNILQLLCTHKSISEMINDYNRLVSDLRSRSYENYSSLTVVTDKPLPINCCSYINPVFFIDGRIYQDFNDLSIDLDSYSFTAFSSEGHGYFHFGWNNSTRFNQYFNQFQNIDNHKFIDFLIQMIFAYSENHAFNKDWWDELSVNQKNQLKKIFFSDIMNQPYAYNAIEDFTYAGFSNILITNIIKKF